MNSVAKIFELLVESAAYGAEGLLKRIKSASLDYIKVLGAAVILWIIMFFGLVAAKTSGAQSLLFYLVAMLTIILTMVMSVLLTPLGIAIGMFWEGTPNPRTAGKLYIRTAGIGLLVILIAINLIIKLPLENNPGAVLGLIISSAILVLCMALFGTLFSGEFYTLIATVLFLITILSFFLPQTFGEWLPEKIRSLDYNIAHPSNKSPAIAENWPSPPIATTPQPFHPQVTVKKQQQQQPPPPAIVAKKQSPQSSLVDPQPVAVAKPSPPPATSTVSKIVANEWSQSVTLKEGAINYSGDGAWIDFKFQENGRQIIARFVKKQGRLFRATEGGRILGLYNGGLSGKHAQIRSDQTGEIRFTP